MNNHMIMQADGMAVSRRNRRRWTAVLIVLSVIVAAVVAAWLTKVAQAKTHTEKLLTCSYQVHQHTADCYDADGNLTCGLADYVIHTHNDDCYDADGNLICPLPEVQAHTHDDSCYVEETYLTCGLEESAGHTHTAECYEEVPILVCENEDPDHMHTEECYEYEMVLICGQDEYEGHTHTADCYTTVRTLVCNKPEIESHIHTDACYSIQYETQLDESGNEVQVEVGRTLICGKLQVEEHIHTTDCFTTVEMTADEVEELTGEEYTAAETAEPETGAASAEPTAEDTDHALYTTEDTTEDIAEDTTENTTEDIASEEITGAAASGEVTDTASAELQNSEESAASNELPVEETEPDRVLTAETDSVIVTAVVPADSDLPENAELRVREITPDDESYDGYVEQTGEVLGTDVSDANNMVLDIGFFVDDIEIEPGTEVGISIAFRDAAYENGDTLSVTHFDGEEESPELVGISNVDADEIEFTSDGFSVYTVTDAGEAQTTVGDDTINLMTTDTFEGNGGIYSLDYILSYFSIFSFGDLDTINHIMGAIAVKGDATLAWIGRNADDPAWEDIDISPSPLTSSYFGGKVYLPDGTHYADSNRKMYGDSALKEGWWSVGYYMGTDNLETTTVDGEEVQHDTGLLNRDTVSYIAAYNNKLIAQNSLPDAPSVPETFTADTYEAYNAAVETYNAAVEAYNNAHSADLQYLHIWQGFMGFTNSYIDWNKAYNAITGTISKVPTYADVTISADDIVNVASYASTDNGNLNAIKAFRQADGTIRLYHYYNNNWDTSPDGTTEGTYLYGIYRDGNNGKAKVDVAQDNTFLIGSDADTNYNSVMRYISEFNVCGSEGYHSGTDTIVYYGGVPDQGDYKGNSSGYMSMPVTHYNGSQVNFEEKTNVGQSVSFIFPNVTEIEFKTSESYLGNVISPDAMVKFSANGNFNGTLICGDVHINGEFEFHIFPYNGLLLAESQLYAYKTVDNETPNENFTFRVEEWRNGKWQLLSTAENIGKNIKFPVIEYTAAGDVGTHWYRITEDADDYYFCDSHVYLAKITVNWINKDPLNGMEAQENPDYYDITGLEITSTDDLFAVAARTGEDSLAVEPENVKFNNRPAYTDITARKIWADANGNSISAPVSGITVQLQQKCGSDGEWKNYGDPVTLSAANAWRYTWKLLPSRDEETDTHYTYRAIETAVPGYTVTYSDNWNGVEKGTIKITNTRDTSIILQKVWQNVDGTETSVASLNAGISYQVHQVATELEVNSDAEEETLSVRYYSGWGNWGEATLTESVAVGSSVRIKVEGIVTNFWGVSENTAGLTFTCDGDGSDKSVCKTYYSNYFKFTDSKSLEIKLNGQFQDCEVTIEVLPSYTVKAGGITQDTVYTTDTLTAPYWRADLKNLPTLGTYTDDEGVEHTMQYTYYIEETGYENIGRSVSSTEYSTDGTNWHAAKENAAFDPNEVDEVYIRNTLQDDGLDMPSTGGCGTTIFTAAGLLLIGAAFALVIGTRRRYRRDAA